MILPKERDPRFVTIRRGGTLTDSDHRLLALWAVACAEHVLGLFEEIHEGGTTVLFATHDRSLLDVRPRRLIVLDEGKAVDVPNGVATAEDDLYDNELPV